MDVLYFLIPISIAIGVILVGFLIWGIKTSQFEDLTGEGERIVFDEELK